MGVEPTRDSDYCPADGLKPSISARTPDDYNPMISRDTHHHNPLWISLPLRF